MFTFPTAQRTFDQEVLMTWVELGSTDRLEVRLQQALMQCRHFSQIDWSCVVILGKGLYFLHCISWLNLDLLLVLSFFQRESCESADGSAGPLALKPGSQAVFVL